MKGVIFNAFEAFVSSTWSDGVFETVLAQSDLETAEPFVGPGTYPASDLLTLVMTTCRLVDAEPEEVVRSFGRFSFPLLARSVSDLMAGFTDARTFLEQLEPLVHAEVRKLDPEAAPAQFSVESCGQDTILLRYRSPLRLYALVHGLLDGTADWFGTPFDHELERVDGDVATFRLDFAPNPRGAGASSSTVVARG